MPAPAGTADFTALEAALEEKRAAVDAALPGLLRRGAPEVDAAVEYSLLAGAKRVRPVLTLMVADLFHVEARVVLPAACAVEMAHTASLILDDLPCMDDAQLRRGKETCHRAHGEANAVLARSRSSTARSSCWPKGGRAVPTRPCAPRWAASWPARWARRG